MSTTTTTRPAPPAALDDTAVDTAQDEAIANNLARRQKVEERAKKIYAAQVKKEMRKLPDDRTKPEALWRAALREATREVRAEHFKTRTKQLARQTATGARVEAASVWHRNRRQLTPWLLAAPYAAVGEAAWLTAEYGAGASPIGIAAITAASTAGASLLAWRKKIGARTPAKFRAKAQAAMAALCGWSTAMPLIDGAGQSGMWLAMLAGTSYMGLSWWREHAHPIPLAEDVAALTVTTIGGPVTEDSAEPVDTAFGERVVSDWTSFVVGMGTLTGSELTSPRRIEFGWTFLLHLVRGRQKLADVRVAKENIAAALDLEIGNISFDRDTRVGATQNTVVMTVITDEISNAYDGPRIICEGGDIFIEIGPYEDGFGSARFHVLADQLTDAEIADGQRPRGSMNGGFALGTKGSGKSRLLEEIAVGLRKLGIEIWYLDPQQGKSSPALMAESDWPLAGVHGTKGAFSNVVDLWRALKAACEVREAEAAGGEQGFQHTRERPAIMVMIDECHGVFQVDNPETGNSFGQDFAELDRIMRKNGVGLFGASQSITQDTFGRGNSAAVLRDGMCAVNVFLMSYGGKNLRLAPGYEDQPCGSLPVNQGLGYSPKGERPHTRWQARYTTDFQPWLAKYARATLDQRVQKRIGQTYLRRFEQHAENQAAKHEWLAALDAAEDASTLPALGDDTNKGKTPSVEAQDAAAALLSPRQRRLQAAGQEQDTPEQEQGGDSATTAVGELTAAEQRVLDIVADEPQTPTSLSGRLGIASQVAGRHLRNIAAKGRAVRGTNGYYTAVTS